MATTNTWAQVVEKISGVVNRGAFSKTFTPTTSSQSASSAAGYYSSVSTTCNAVSLSGNAGVAQVLTGYTFYSNSLTRQTGTMVNRGALNWTPTGSTTYSVPAGYYSGGTLNSGTAYTNGYNAGVNAGKATLKFSTYCKKIDDGVSSALTITSPGKGQCDIYVPYSGKGYTGTKNGAAFSVTNSSSTNSSIPQNKTSVSVNSGDVIQVYCTDSATKYAIAAIATV